MGPYGVGRAPTPLMHAPVGHAYGHPFGVPIIGRDSFSFCRSSALRAPGSNGCPKGHPYVHPEGCTLYNACARVRVREAPSGQFRPFYSRFRPKLAGDFLLGSTS